MFVLMQNHKVVKVNLSHSGAKMCPYSRHNAEIEALLSDTTALVVGIKTISFTTKATWEVEPITSRGTIMTFKKHLNA